MELSGWKWGQSLMPWTPEELNLSWLLQPQVMGESATCGCPGNAGSEVRPHLCAPLTANEQWPQSLRMSTSQLQMLWTVSNIWTCLSCWWKGNIMKLWDTKWIFCSSKMAAVRSVVVLETGSQLLKQSVEAWIDHSCILPLFDLFTFNFKLDVTIITTSTLII